jgi:hypothetical protein
MTIGRLEDKGLAIGAALKKVQYLVFIIHHHRQAV